MPKDKKLDFQPAGSNFKESEACPALPSLAMPGQQRPETKPDLPLTPSGQSLYCPNGWDPVVFSTYMNNGWFSKAKGSLRHGPTLESERFPYPRPISPNSSTLHVSTSSPFTHSNPLYVAPRSPVTSYAKSGRCLIRYPPWPLYLALPVSSLALCPSASRWPFLRLFLISWASWSSLSLSALTHRVASTTTYRHMTFTYPCPVPT